MKFINLWLRVTVLSAGTGLNEDDVHYWGNQIAESGTISRQYCCGVRRPESTSLDTILDLTTPQSIGPFDMNRNARVGSDDVIAVVANSTGLTSLELISPSESPPEAVALREDEIARRDIQIAALRLIVVKGLVGNDDDRKQFAHKKIKRDRQGSREMTLDLHANLSDRMWPAINIRQIDFRLKAQKDRIVDKVIDSELNWHVVD